MVPEVSVGIVNYRSTELLLGAVDTLLRDAVAAFGSVDAVDVAVVENASGDDSVAQLEARLPSGVKLVVNTLNAGYAKANNQAFAVTRGRLHLVLNPDCRVVSGMLAGLRDALDAHPEAGMVGPNVSMDEDGDVLLPPNEMVDPFVDALAHTTRTSDAVARWNARRRARFAHSVWKAVHPMPVPMLSGGCFMGRRSDFRRLGLFDAGYPLYYEDTDLFRRFVDAGMTLLQVPSVRVVHFFSRSAMQRPKATGWRNAVSARRYFERWFGAEGLATHDFFRARGAERARDGTPPWPIVELEPSSEPPVLEVVGPPGTYLEVAGGPKFTLAAGIFPASTGRFKIPRGFFEGLGPTHYWVRSVDPATGDTIASWRFTKR